MNKVDIRAARHEDAHFDLSWDALRPYGINYLTGEACGYSLRVLCDMSEAGVELLTVYFGNCLEFRRGSNWNSKVGDQPAVASVMLPRGLAKDLISWVAHFTTKKRYICTGPSSIVATDLEDHAQAYRDRGYEVRASSAWRPGLNQTACGDRNVHSFSGRAF